MWRKLANQYRIAADSLVALRVIMQRLQGSSCIIPGKSNPQCEYKSTVTLGCQHIISSQGARTVALVSSLWLWVDNLLLRMCHARLHQVMHVLVHQKPQHVEGACENAESDHRSIRSLLFERNPYTLIIASFLFLSLILPKEGALFTVNSLII